MKRIIRDSAIFGEALAAVENDDEAYYIYSQGIVQFERIRLINTGFANENRQEWFAQTVPYYKKAAAFFVRLNEDLEAFRAVELCKGRTLADQYRELLAIYKAGLQKDEILKLNEYKNKFYRYKDNFSKEFQNGNEALKLNLRMA